MSASELLSDCYTISICFVVPRVKSLNSWQNNAKEYDRVNKPLNRPKELLVELGNPLSPNDIRIPVYDDEEELTYMYPPDYYAFIGGALLDLIKRWNG